MRIRFNTFLSEKARDSHDFLRKMESPKGIWIFFLFKICSTHRVTSAQHIIYQTNPSATIKNLSLHSMFQHTLFQYFYILSSATHGFFLNWGLEVDVDILNFLAVFKRIFMDISLFWCQTMWGLGWFPCLLWIFIRHQLFNEPLVP